ncbi:hypothetical protein OG563_37580 [Nocardia vinacea]|uniref:MarR family transcriptional regulator n=1 Tax=Nocardia vinacea TaxID=96468 RepID=A0ABZ1YNK9_9NOCA|nr:hypothetical protein [Nocardia vinacea]
MMTRTLERQAVDPSTPLDPSDQRTLRETLVVMLSEAPGLASDIAASLQLPEAVVHAVLVDLVAEELAVEGYDGSVCWYGARTIGTV